MKALERTVAEVTYPDPPNNGTHRYFIVPQMESTIILFHLSRHLWCKLII